ncbi:helix-turn-helix domain-containing protein [Pseudomonas sichuanensis]|uniref:helix-turn-helix domain-containing protein n=1 Tax=Pseudomonas sichuanensis TaxID=2213015 RepID=UPI0036EE017F
MQMELNRAFGLGLKRVRKNKGLTQEAFSGVSSRTYLSSLERGIKGPTIEKVDQVAEVLGVHPATLLIVSYLLRDDLSEGDQKALLSRIESEVLSFFQAD